MESQQMTPTIPPQPPIPVEQKPASSNKTFKIILLVFLFILLAAVLAYAVQNYQSQPQSDLLPQPEEVPVNETEELKTFTDSKIGFSFQYPSTWYQGTSSDKLYNFTPEFEEYERTLGEFSEYLKTINDPQTLHIFISGLEKATYTFEEWVELYEVSSKSELLESGSTISEADVQDFGAVKTYVLKGCDDPNNVIHTSLPCFVYVYIPHGDTSIELQFRGASIQPEIVDQILSSFRFVDNDPLNTSNWRVYKFEDAEIKYPPTWEEVSEEIPAEYQNKMWYRKCTGPSFRNSKIPNTIIGVEIVDPESTDGDMCWSRGDFTQSYQRSIDTLQFKPSIKVIRWQSTSQTSSTWRGDLIQFHEINRKSSSSNGYIFTLIYQDGKDSTAEDTFDTVLSTFKFVE